MLEAAGCHDVETRDNHQAPGLDIHEMGGARMGRDPKTSMLNEWNQVHACKNVFVTGWQINGALPSVDTVAERIDAKGPQANAFPTGYAPDQNTINQAVAKSQGNDVIVVLVYNVWQGAQLLSPQEALVDSLVKTGKPVIVIAQGTPYDAAYLPGVAAFLNAWNYHSTSLITAADTLFGDVNPKGKLSVTITEPPPSTTSSGKPLIVR